MKNKAIAALFSGAMLLGGWWINTSPEWNNYEPILGSGYSNYEPYGYGYGMGGGYGGYGGYSGNPYSYVSNNPYVSQYTSGPIGGYYTNYPYNTGYANYGYGYGSNGWY